MKKLLTDDFIAGYPEFPKHMNALGQFVYYRTYSRFLPEKGRRETWKETCRMATEYNVGLGVKHVKKIGYEVDYEKYRKEAEDFFDNMFNLRQFLSGRTQIGRASCRERVEEAVDRGGVQDVHGEHGVQSKEVGKR